MKIHLGRNHVRYCMRYCMRHFRQTHASFQCAKRKQKRKSVDIANARGEIRTHNLRKREDTELRLRPRGHCGRQL